MVPATWRGWLEVMCQPDGAIGFLDDAAMGIAPTLAQLTDYAGRLGLRSELRGQKVTGTEGRAWTLSGQA